MMHLFEMSVPFNVRIYFHMVEHFADVYVEN